jgi:hypothetical protein
VRVGWFIFVNKVGCCGVRIPSTGDHDIVPCEQLTVSR